MKSIIFVAFLNFLSLSTYSSYTDTQVPSFSAGSSGLRTRIFTPDSARYSGGAPVIIYLQGGNVADNIDTSSRFTRFGFIVITFNYPGGTGSGGTYDNRGPACIAALRDIVKFATGVITDNTGRKLDQITIPVIPVYGNVGLMGSSNGGNVSIVTAGMYGNEINLAWISNWESPVGEEMPGAELGRRGNANGNPYYNPSYNDTTGVINYLMLRYSDTVSVYNQSTVFHGGFYYDINGNNIPNRGTDFIINGYWVVNNSVLKSIISARLLREAVNRGLYPASPPPHLPSIAEAEDYWKYRTGDVWIDSVKTKLPNLMFMVTASDSDHVQSQKDHPHVLIQYEKFRAAGQRFVRLNPDRVYVEYVSGLSQPTVPDNDAFEIFTHLSIRTKLEPETVSDINYQSAAVCELADRTYSGDTNANLNTIINCATIGIQQNGSFIPSDFVLEQNYPNPFNPLTKIRFRIPVSGNVLVKIFDLTGREVTEIINKPLEPGTYDADWDARAFSSGVYFYTIIYGGFTQTRKMILIK